MQGGQERCRESSKEQRAHGEGQHRWESWSPGGLLRVKCRREWQWSRGLQGFVLSKLPCAETGKPTEGTGLLRTLMFGFYFVGIKKPHTCLSERYQVSDCVQEARGRSGRINLTRYWKPCDRMRSTNEEASEDKRPSTEHGTHTHPSSTSRGETTMSGIENTLGGIDSRWNTARKNSDFKDRATEIIQNETQKERLARKKQSSH